MSKRTKRKRPSGASTFRVGLIALLILIPVMYFGLTKSIPFKPTFTIKAAVPTANLLKTASFVRIAGVQVGEVKKVEPAPGGRQAAVVTMEITKMGQPIHKDATLTIRPRIFLEGNFFVDLHPGSPSAPVMEKGDTLPIQQASAPVQLDQVLSSFNGDVRNDLRTLLREYGRAVQDGADGFRRSQKYWKDAYKYSALLADASHGKKEHDLSRFIRAAGPVAEAIDANPGQLKSLVSDFNTTALALARVNGSVSDTIRELPRTLAVGRPALGDLNASFPSLRRLSDALRPGVRSTGRMIPAVMPFVRQLRALVQESELRGLTRDLRPVVPALARLQDRLPSLFEQVRSASSCQNKVILPWTRLRVPDEKFKPKGNVLVESTQWLPGIANESTSGDANGQWFRVLAGGGTNIYGLGNGQVGNTLLPIQGEQPPKPTVRPDIRPKSPCENQQLPDLRTGTAEPPKPVNVPLTPDLLKATEAARQEAILGLRTLSALSGSGVQVQEEPAGPGDIPGLVGGLLSRRSSKQGKDGDKPDNVAPPMTKAEAVKWLADWYKDPKARRAKDAKAAEKAKSDTKAAGK
jgi:phospholipid/cholesterol/gamma-HCH transport system substrate-binding protein